MKIIKKYSFEQYLTKDLIGFLKKENLMDFVEEEAKKQWEINNDNIKWNGNSYPIPINSVDSLFSWRITKQGNDFWINISIKYSEFLDNKYPF